MLSRPSRSAGPRGRRRHARDTLAAFQSAAAQADAIVTSGGVSVATSRLRDGDARATREDRLSGKSRMKPGKPIAFGQFGPASLRPARNPVSVMVHVLPVVQPALRALDGVSDSDRDHAARRLRDAPAQETRPPGIPARCPPAGPHGAYTVRKQCHQGAGVLRSMSEGQLLHRAAARNRGTSTPAQKSTCSRLTGLV